MPAYVRFDRKCDEDDNNGDRGPGCADGVDHGEELVSKGTDNHCDEADSEENEEDLPCWEDVFGVIHPNSSNDQGSKSEIDRQSDCPVANKPDPSSN